jgi:RimJ/RimL family protein N-acetyltransferase
MRVDDNYRGTIKERLVAKQIKNSKYSLRAFALKCGVSQSLLSQVLTGKKNLSLISALKIVNQLELNQQEKDLFLKDVEKNIYKKQFLRKQCIEYKQENIDIYLKGDSMFKGKIVRFRAHKKSDVEDYAKLFCNDYETKYNQNPKLILPSSDEIDDDIFKTEEGADDLSFAIETISDGAFIGYAYIYNVDMKNRKCYFEIVLAKDYSGQAHESEAASLLTSFVFNEYNMRKLVMGVLEYDEGSSALYKQVGFKEEARFKEDFYRNGKYYDMIYLTMFQQDFNR